MYALDFEYDKQYLSEYNCMICDFNSSSGAVSASAGSTITFNRVSRNYGRIFSLTGTQYDSCIETTFDICKDPEKDDTKFFTEDEYRSLARWLNRHDGFHQFRIFAVDNDVDTCYYNASFNIEKIKVADRVCGLRLNMFTDRPYGYGELQKTTVVTTRTQTLVERKIKDVSDDIGDIIPSLSITCATAGDLKITNLTNGSVFMILGCTTNEVITVDGDTLMLKSSKGRNLWDSFNFQYLKFSNTMDNRINKITVSLPSTIVFSYRPIIKDSP